MEKPKVIHVLYSGLGGHGNVVIPLVESEFGNIFNNVLIFFGVEQTRVEYIEKCKTSNLAHYSIIKKPKQYIKPFSVFSKILAKESPDFIIVHSSELIIPAVFYAKKHKCGVVYAEHEPNHSKTKFEKLLSKFSSKFADKIVCLNAAYKNTAGINHEKIIVIPNGVNHHFYQPKEKNQVGVLGMAARIVDTKDHLNLILSFKTVLKKHPHLKLKIAGDGNLKNQMLKLVNKNKLESQVSFVGLLNEDELIKFYQSLNVYVHATKSETLSTSILQAMSCGLPVITSNIENNAILIEEGSTGWLYKDQNAVDLANKINFVVEHPDLANKVGLHARTHVRENYTIENMAKLYITVLNEIKL